MERIVEGLEVREGWPQRVGFREKKRLSRDPDARRKMAETIITKVKRPLMSCRFTGETTSLHPIARLGRLMESSPRPPGPRAGPIEETPYGTRRFFFCFAVHGAGGVLVSSCGRRGGLWRAI